MKLIINNASTSSRLLGKNEDEITSVSLLIDGGKIAALSETPITIKSVKTIDAKGLFLSPGLLDRSPSTFQGTGDGIQRRHRIG